MLHALIIDDELSARNDLREKLAAHHNLAVVGEAATLRSAGALLTSVDYNVVFFDVQLIGGDSFQLIPLVRPGASIVFATAHERYAVRAFENHAVDYLLKPIDSARLADALHRVAQEHALPPAQPPAHAAPRGPRPNAGTAAPGRIVPDDTVEVALSKDERMFLRQMLQAWEDSLPLDHALRASASPQARLPRVIRYEQDPERARLFLAPPRISAARRWWRSLCRPFAA